MDTACREIFPVIEKNSPAVRVLVVDDEALIRWSLSERLSGAGYEVCEAEDGASALSYFQADSTLIDLAVLDLKLPDTDGVTLIKQVKMVSPGCRVILMTAFVTPEKVAEARQLGAFDVLPKPFNLDQMVATVGRALL